MIAFTHTHTYIDTYTQTHTYIHTYIHKHTYSYIQIHIYKHIYARARAHTHTHTHIYIYIYIYIQHGGTNSVTVFWVVTPCSSVYRYKFFRYRYRSPHNKVWCTEGSSSITLSFARRVMEGDQCHAPATLSPGPNVDTHRIGG